MSIISTLGDLLASGGVGAIVGAVGSYFAKREERKLLAEKHQYNLADRELDLREQEAEQSHAVAMADKKMELAEVEGDIAVDVADSSAFVESVKGSSKTTGSPVGDFVKGLMRPLITMYLLVIVSILGWKLHALIGGLTGLANDEVFALYNEIITSTIFLCMVSVTWWFGSRPHAKHSRK